MGEFLQELFGTKRASDNVLIWVKSKIKGGTSHWFTNLKQAETFAVERAGESDVYFGLGLADRDYGRKQRVKADDVAAIPGVWSEVDSKTGSTDIHKKEARLPTEEEALAFIRELPFKASVIVFSGHGFHVYWLFDKLWQLADSGERERAKRLVERWQCHCKALAERHNWAFDSTFDLARVYRVPGTKNHKGKEPSTVKIVETNEGRYTVEQIEGFLDSLPEEERPLAVRAEGAREIRERAAEAGALRLAPNAEIDRAKFEMLCDAEPKFRQTWELKRKDLRDQSPSSYDMALANRAAMAGWDNQEIVNLLIAFRRKHNFDLKLRHDYYTMTIATARHSTSKTEELSGDELWDDEDSDDTLADDAPGEICDAQQWREAALHHLRLALKGKVRGKLQPLPVNRVIKRGLSRAAYDIELTDGSLIMLGSASDLLTPRKVQSAITDAYGLVIKNFTSAKWRPIAQLICDIAEIVETYDEELETLDWLGDFVRGFRSGPVDMNDNEMLRDTINGLRDYSFPVNGFRDTQGRLYIRLNEFVRHITLNYGQRTTVRDTANRLSRLGFKRDQPSVRTGKRTDKVRVWVSPPQFVEDGEEGDMPITIRTSTLSPFIQ